MKLIRWSIGQTVVHRSFSTLNGAHQNMQTRLLTETQLLYLILIKVNLFYLTNWLHDLAYQYGFTESAGNFQESNYMAEGLVTAAANDSIDVLCQSNEGLNNAYMSTPPDGQRAKLAMFLFDSTDNSRDGSLENAIPIHEFTHGVSNRLTGGATNPECLEKTESGGMGEVIVSNSGMVRRGRCFPRHVGRQNP
jgi:Fungalysin metallopeptidase (M36)